MPHAGEDFKGRAKEAAGSLTGDDDLRREGKADQASATVKDKAERLKDNVEGVVDDVKDRAQGAIHH